MRVEVFGDLAHQDISKFTAALQEQCNFLTIPLVVVPRGTGQVPDITVVFCDPTSLWGPADATYFEKLKQAKDPLLPVIDKPNDAAFLPPALKEINAFKKSDTGSAWVDTLVDEVLGMSWLKRRTRKVFMSYKRTDSSPIAVQFFDHFNALGYEIFLDDASIDRGVHFQNDLMWWLNDADLLLVLGSPDFPNSKWCMDEVTFAQTHSIGIAVIEWPEEIYRSQVEFHGKLNWPEPVIPASATSDQRLRLDLRSFEGVNADSPPPDPELQKHELTPEALTAVVGFCARNRARAIRARLNELVPLVRDTLTQSNATNFVQDFGDLSYEDAQQQKCFVRILPFRPRPEHIHEAFSSQQAGSRWACAYSESDLTDTRTEALRWLVAGGRVSTAAASTTRSPLWVFCGEKLL